MFPSLQPGVYTLTVEAVGFRKAVLERMELTVGDTVSQAVRLEVGPATESVVVEANAVRVQTADPQIARAITLRDIDVLGQLSRAPIELAILATPGIQIQPGYAYGFSRVNGLRQGSANSTLDGIGTSDLVSPRTGLIMVSNNTDTVGEFRIVASGGKAEYGPDAGAQIEMITRSGSNRWSGNAFEYLRNHVLHANDFFNNSTPPGVPRPKFI